MNSYFDVFRKYGVFSGRASRKEYWTFALVNGIIFTILNILHNTPLIVSVLVIIYCLAIVIPAIAVTVRRLHDTNRNGWWFIFGLIPVIGTITLLIFTVADSQSGANQYGQNPKGL